MRMTIYVYADGLTPSLHLPLLRAVVKSNAGELPELREMWRHAAHACQANLALRACLGEGKEKPAADATVETAERLERRVCQRCNGTGKEFWAGTPCAACNGHGELFAKPGKQSLEGLLRR